MDTVADISETVFFTCSASGIPLPDISWYKGDMPLDSLTDNITESRNGTVSISSVLVLSDLILSDAGVYSCNASHPDSGTDIREFSLTLQSKCLVVILSLENNPGMKQWWWRICSFLETQLQMLEKTLSSVALQVEYLLLRSPG